MKQVTKEEAVKIYNSKLWADWSHEHRAYFQLMQDKLSMPIDVFKHSLSVVLKRPIFTHDLLNKDGLIAEMKGEIPTPTFEETLELLPKHLKVISIKL